MQSRSNLRLGFSFEYLMWMLTRISGIGLFLLSFIGIASAFWLGARNQVDIGALMRWTFFPNPNHVVNTDIPDITLGWANAYWQIMQMLVLFLGVTHGFNGLRVVLEDYVGKSWLLPLARGLVFLFWLFFIIAGVYVILAS
jgi:succinate dehydrogenase / fumarate reductase, membrane anchor subunit